MTGVTGMLALLIAVLGTTILTALVVRVRRELEPTRTSFDRLGRELRPALIELRTDTERIRAEIARRERDR
jgi:hypothetical protein